MWHGSSRLWWSLPRNLTLWPLVGLRLARRGGVACLADSTLEIEAMFWLCKRVRVTHQHEHSFKDAGSRHGAVYKKTYGRPRRHVLVAAQEIVQAPTVPYHTLPYSQISRRWSTVPYRTAITDTEKAPRLARFLYRTAWKNHHKLVHTSPEAGLGGYGLIKGLGHVPFLDKPGRQHKH